jgi:hypothetical protein
LKVKKPPPGVDDFYGKYALTRGIPIFGSFEVLDRSFALVAGVVTKMLRKRPDIRRALIKQNTSVSILSVDGIFTDLPEMRIWKGRKVLVGAPMTFDEVRGGGGVRGNPVTVICERNLCGIRDPYLNKGFSVATHEFAHSIHNLGLKGPERAAVTRAFKKALKAKLFRRPNGEIAYMLSNAMEYFAGGSDLWFNSYERENPWTDPTVFCRKDLKTRDPALYKILEKIYPKTNS